MYGNYKILLVALYRFLVWNNKNLKRDEEQVANQLHYGIQINTLAYIMLFFVMIKVTANKNGFSTNNIYASIFGWTIIVICCGCNYYLLDYRNNYKKILAQYDGVEVNFKKIVGYYFLSLIACIVAIFVIGALAE